METLTDEAMYDKGVEIFNAEIARLTSPETAQRWQDADGEDEEIEASLTAARKAGMAAIEKWLDESYPDRPRTDCMVCGKPQVLVTIPYNSIEVECCCVCGFSVRAK